VSEIKTNAELTDYPKAPPPTTSFSCTGSFTLTSQVLLSQHSVNISSYVSTVIVCVGNVFVVMKDYLPENVNTKQYYYD
jgi:hypothetical protein